MMPLNGLLFRFLTPTTSLLTAIAEPDEKKGVSSENAPLEKKRVERVRVLWNEATNNVYNTRPMDMTSQLNEIQALRDCALRFPCGYMDLMSLLACGLPLVHAHKLSRLSYERSVENSYMVSEKLVHESRALYARTIEQLTVNMRTHPLDVRILAVLARGVGDESDPVYNTCIPLEPQSEFLGSTVPQNPNCAHELKRL
jgi:hypothetical protein